MQQQVDQEAARLSSQYELGVLKRKYDRKRWSAIKLFVCSFFLLLICLLFIFRPIFNWLTSRLCDTLSCIGPTNVTEDVGHVFLFGLFLLIACIFWGIFRRYGSEDWLYEHGFFRIACRYRQIIGSEAIHWREVTIWHNFGYMDSAYSETYKLCYRNGDIFGSRIGDRTITIDLGKHIEQVSLPYLFPSVLSAYQQGLPVSFGPLTLHTEGIEYDKRLLTNDKAWPPIPVVKHIEDRRLLHWHEFDCLDMDERSGQLSIYQKKSPQSFFATRLPWTILNCGEVPNVALLRHLILSITDAPRGSIDGHR